MRFIGKPEQLGGPILENIPTDFPLQISRKVWKENGVWEEKESNKDNFVRICKCGKRFIV